MTGTHIETHVEGEPERLDQDRQFAQRLGATLRKFDIVPADEARKDEPRTADLRRRRRRRFDEPVGVMTLVDEDGVLRWRIGNGAPPRRRPQLRGARRGPLPPGGRIVEQFKFADLPPNQIGSALRRLDETLTPHQGLFEVRMGKDGPEVAVGDPPVPPPASGRVLLLVHGTFSNCENVVAELASTPAGLEFLKHALTGETWKKVLAFDHPTVSVSPILNAAALASRFRGSRAQVDVLCHSRGGLVTRWWLEILDGDARAAPRGSVVFVGSPLAGTGLAAPHRLKGALDVLTNVSKALSLAARGAGTVLPLAQPLGHAAGVLFSLFGKVTSFAARTPLLDAGVSMIPGLAGQSREGGNAEILRLRESFLALPAAERATRFLDRYWFVTSNFETEDVGWRFWRAFRKQNVLDVGADVVFEGDNDLVVDSSSMTDMADGLSLQELERSHVHDFGTSDVVHHCNYFRQAKTLALMKQAFA